MKISLNQSESSSSKAHLLWLQKEMAIMASIVINNVSRLMK
jgi:hypothetical protein